MHLKFWIPYFECSWKFRNQILVKCPWGLVFYFVLVYGLFTCKIIFNFTCDGLSCLEFYGWVSTICYHLCHWVHENVSNSAYMFRILSHTYASLSGKEKKFLCWLISFLGCFFDKANLNTDSNSFDLCSGLKRSYSCGYGVPSINTKWFWWK